MGRRGEGRGIWSWPMIWGMAGMVAAGPVIVLWALGFFFETVPDVVWGVRHHWTAVYGGERFRVPIGWRQVGTSAGERGVELRDTMGLRLGLFRFDSMSLRASDRPFNAERLEVRSDRLQTRLLTPGETLEATPADGYLRTHYVCTDVLRLRDGAIQVTCFERKGRWVVSARGGAGVIEDMAATVRGLEGAERP